MVAPDDLTFSFAKGFQELLEQHGIIATLAHTHNGYGVCFSDFECFIGDANHGLIIVIRHRYMFESFNLICRHRDKTFRVQLNQPDSLELAVEHAIRVTNEVAR